MKLHWLIHVQFEPKPKTDLDRLLAALAQIALEDQAIGYSHDPQSSAVTVKATSEQEVDAVVRLLEQKFGISVLLSAPQVAYRETLTRATDVDYTHKKQTGGTGQFARVKFRLEPNEVGKGNEFASEAIGGTVPKEYIPGVEKGVQSVWDAGVLIGFPMVDMKVTLYDGAFHDVDSSAIAFEIASRNAMNEGCTKAGVKLLEPIMDVEVVTPGDFVGGVIGDINSRRGQIRSQEMRGNASVVRANVPLENMFGYEGDLRSMTKGQVHFTMRFSHYAPVPRNNGPDNFPPAVGMRA